MIRCIIVGALLVYLSTQAVGREAGIVVTPDGGGLPKVDLSGSGLTNDFCESKDKKCSGTEIGSPKFCPTLQNCVARCRRDMKCVELFFGKDKFCHLLEARCAGNGMTASPGGISLYRLEKGEKCPAGQPKWVYTFVAYSDIFCEAPGKRCKGNNLYDKPQNIAPFMDCLRKCAKMNECGMVDFNGKCEPKEKQCPDSELVDAPGYSNYLRLEANKEQCPPNRVIPTEHPPTIAPGPVTTNAPPAPKPEPVQPATPKPKPADCQFGIDMKSPSVPIITPLEGAAVPGRTFYAHGLIKSNAQRFSLNLRINDGTGCSEDVWWTCNQIPLHYDIRFWAHDNAVVLNSHLGGWGKEEREVNPFVKGNRFSIKVVATDTFYQIYANGVIIHDYQYRGVDSALDINNIQFTGDVQLDGFSVSCIGQGCNDGVVLHGPSVPINVPGIKGGFPNGRVVVAKGRIHSNAKRFTLNLRISDGSGCSEDKWWVCNDIALHYDVRVSANTFVFNSFLRRWGREERKRNTFRKGTPFEMRVEATNDAFKIFANGQLIHTYKSRGGHDKVLEINDITLTGDVTVDVLTVSCINVGCIHGVDKTNPSVPIRQTFDGGMIDGRTVVARGNIKSNGKRFTMNLASECRNGVDCSKILLHYDVRYWYNKPVIVFNTFYNGRWGREERKVSQFKKKSDFEMKVVATLTSFLIYGNGNHIHTYKFREASQIPNIKYVELTGDVTLTKLSVSCIKQGFEPECSNAVQINKPSVPIQTSVDGGFPVGRQAIARGHINSDANRFTMNLRINDGSGCSQDQWWVCNDIPLHYDVRFWANTFVFNSYLRGWGKEERVANTFQKGTPFEMRVEATSDAFKIFANNALIRTYKYRGADKVLSINNIHVNGDVKLDELIVTCI